MFVASQTQRIWLGIVWVALAVSTLLGLVNHTNQWTLCVVAWFGGIMSVFVWLAIRDLHKAKEHD